MQSTNARKSRLRVFFLFFSSRFGCCCVFSFLFFVYLLSLRVREKPFSHASPQIRTTRTRSAGGPTSILVPIHSDSTSKEHDEQRSSGVSTTVRTRSLGVLLKPVTGFHSAVGAGPLAPNPSRAEKGSILRPHYPRTVKGSVLWPRLLRAE